MDNLTNDISQTFCVYCKGPTPTNSEYHPECFELIQAYFLADHTFEKKKYCILCFQPKDDCYVIFCSQCIFFDFFLPDLTLEERVDITEQLNQIYNEVIFRHVEWVRPMTYG